MPRPKLTTPKVLWRIRIPEDLAAEVDLLLFDPVTGNPRYGSKAQLMEQLLRDWVEDQKQPLTLQEELV